MTFARSRPLSVATWLSAWLDDGASARRRWLSRTNVCVAWLGLLLGVLTPPHGSGFTVCWLNATTGLLCPGCGLSRSLSCGLRGLYVESWHYHPFGLGILGLFLATAFFSLLPATSRERIGDTLASRARLSNALYAAFVVTFVCFGVTRSLHHVVCSAPPH